MEKIDREALDAAYRTAQREIDDTVARGVAHIDQEAAAKRSFNSGATVKRIVELKRTALTKAVEALIAAHLQAGAAEHGEVTRRIGGLLNVQTADHDLRAHSPNTKEVGTQAFSSMLALLLTELPDLVAVALLERRSKATKLDRLKRWAANRPVLVAAAVLISLIGVATAAIGLVNAIRPTPSAWRTAS